MPESGDNKKRTMPILRPDGFRFWVTFWAQRLFMMPLVWLVFRVFNHVKIEGLENLDEIEGGSIILAPNHTTAWDGFLATLWSFSSRRRLVERDSYTAVLAAPENIPTPPLRVLTSTLGAIPVDRDQGVDQFALSDLVRLMREAQRRVVLTIYPEGTRSKTGRLRRRGRPGIGWVQRQTGATVVPIYHTGGTRMPGLGLRMRIVVGKPLPLTEYQEWPNELLTWRAITKDIMDALRVMEREALGDDPEAVQPPPRRKARARAA